MYVDRKSSGEVCLSGHSWYWEKVLNSAASASYLMLQWVVLGPAWLPSGRTRPPGNPLVGSVENMKNYRWLVHRICAANRRESSSATQFMESSSVVWLYIICFLSSWKISLSRNELKNENVCKIKTKHYICSSQESWWLMRNCTNYLSTFPFLCEGWGDVAGRVKTRNKCVE